MSSKRVVATIFVAFIVSQVLAIAVHGFILASDYQPFYGNLLRPMNPEGDWRMLLLPLSHLCFVSALVWVYLRAGLQGSSPRQGFKLGIVGWLMGQAPLWLLWYAEQPWPGELVLKQLVLELISSLLIALTVVWMAGQRSAEPERARATA